MYKNISIDLSLARAYATLGGGVQTIVELV